MPLISLKQVYISLMVALLAILLPWSGYGQAIRPDFVLLVLLYWMLRAPRLCNMGTAWLSGLVVDLATGSLFGQHALAYALTAFFALAYQRRLTLFNFWQQSAYVFILLLLTQGTLFILKLFAGGESPGWSYFLPSISGALLWQIVTSSSIGIDIHAKK